MPEFHLETLPDPLMTLPVAPLGIIALESSRELGSRINDYLLDWRSTEREDELYSVPGFDRNTFLLDATCPRFANGEGKGLIRQSIRGYDLFILVDVGNYSVEYPLYGKNVPMTPDEHFADLKRIISATAGKARRISAMTRDLSEVLAPLQERLAALATKREAGRIAYHPPCTLQHGQQIRGLVEGVLRAAGVDVVLCQDNHLCCGAAGTYSVLHPEIAQALRERKLASLLATGATAIVSANVGCQGHLQGGTDMPVTHWIELLDRTLGGG